jgi:hypothetical protein
VADRALTFERTRPPTDEASVRRLEERLAAELPGDYRRFILATNGGRLAETLCLEQGDVVVEEFYGFDWPEHGGVYDLYWHLDVLGERLLPGLLPVAGDPFGNSLCLSVRERDFGSIYFWDHELETEPASEANLTLLAPTFDAFVDALGACPEVELPEPSAKSVWVDPDFWAELQRQGVVPADRPPPGSS